MKTDSIAQQLFAFAMNSDMDVTSGIKEKPEDCSFILINDYEKNGTPARKRWKVTVELIEDSTADGLNSCPRCRL